jgi:hypothetical protein
MGYYTLDFDLQILVCGDCLWTFADQFEIVLDFRFTQLAIRHVENLYIEML